MYNRNINDHPLRTGRLIVHRNVDGVPLCGTKARRPVLIRDPKATTCKHCLQKGS
jgi:hypothetical protein